MSKVNLEQLKKLRSETSASVSDVRSADKALALLKKRGTEIAEKKKEREVGQGLVESYIHQNGKVGSLVVLLCETDFVARTDEFKNLAHEIAMQVAAMNPKDVSGLLKQEYIRDPQATIEDLVKQAIGKLGENIVISKIERFEL